jgi:5-(carboxyamino)imidazole ribonucleotide synthase
MDFETVYNFGKVDVLTFEIELVNLEALVKLENEGLKIFPPKTLKLIQNKGIQKILLTLFRQPNTNDLKI